MEDTDNLGGGVGVTDWRPQSLHRGCRYPWRTPVEGSGLPIGGPNLDPSTEVVGVLRGYRRSRWREFHLGVASLGAGVLGFASPSQGS
ncbi:hypothetical protein CDL15_Pgr019587 [Punica granatum]|uniref:Uncharacterized protein n=1 Tax=Punica granatum TaxID=22663 RepID=A0A218X5S2_PUNGR|nr:hypothetical protein CDL15_Pgr019587 [Punica granatum]